MTDPDERATGDGSSGTLIGVLADLVAVLQSVILLARAEVAQGLRGMLRGVGLMIVAALLGLVALNTVANAAVFAVVGLGLSPAWAGLAVGAALLMLAALSLRIALALVNPRNLLPQRALARLRDDVETLKSMVSPDARPESQTAPAAQPEADRGAT